MKNDLFSWKKYFCICARVFLYILYPKTEGLLHLVMLAILVIFEISIQNKLYPHSRLIALENGSVESGWAGKLHRRE